MKKTIKRNTRKTHKNTKNHKNNKNHKITKKIVGGEHPNADDGPKPTYAQLNFSHIMNDNRNISILQSQISKFETNLLSFETNQSPQFDLNDINNFKQICDIINNEINGYAEAVNNQNKLSIFWIRNDLLNKLLQFIYEHIIIFRKKYQIINPDNPKFLNNFNQFLEDRINVPKIVLEDPNYQKIVLDFLNALIRKKQAEYYLANEDIPLPTNTYIPAHVIQTSNENMQTLGNQFCDIILTNLKLKIKIEPQYGGNNENLITLPENIYGEVNNNYSYELLLLKNYIEGNYTFNEKKNNGSKDRDENFRYLIDNLNFIDTAKLQSFSDKINDYFVKRYSFGNNNNGSYIDMINYQRNQKEKREQRKQQQQLPSYGGGKKTKTK